MDGTRTMNLCNGSIATFPDEIRFDFVPDRINFGLKMLPAETNVGLAVGVFLEILGRRKIVPEKDILGREREIRN